MSQSILLSFQANISVHQDLEASFILHSSNLKLDLSHLSAGLKKAIATLQGEGATDEELANLVTQIDGSPNLPQLYYYLQQFIRYGLICHTIRVDRESLATLVPITTSSPWEWAEIEPDKKYKLSRFAYCHREGRQMIWESPLSQMIVSLKDWRCTAIMHQLVQAKTCNALTKIPNVSKQIAQAFLSLLKTAQLLEEIDNNSAESETDTLAQWEFHDLLFHSRSRSGRHSHTVGKSYRFLGKIKPLPAIKPQVSSNVISLYKPDLEKLKQEDLPFTLILESRKSLRVHGDRPISQREVGEFLYRVARLRKVFFRPYMECSTRPYPSGGASYELELYLAINICKGIFPGIYHYCPQNHLLEQISPQNDYLKALLINAQKNNGEDCLPQVLIIITARFARVSWAYESIAYSLILKHVGVLYQTMYLVATAMNLAPCALGTGNPNLFATATGIDYYAESSVGEFILGKQ
ncbi:MAG: SagB family peptide dehydrogenase [Xenococcaceae cyanobacterium MO_188.B32]|nr:SagB family peptide dehydrogenase [Xenococcaceae cyanobacterium MO_188.B32]